MSSSTQRNNMKPLNLSIFQYENTLNHITGRTCYLFDSVHAQGGRLTVDGGKELLIFSGKNTGVCCHFLLQGIFQTQGSNSGLLCYGHSLPSELPGDPTRYHTIWISYYKYFHLKSNCKCNIIAQINDLMSLSSPYFCVFSKYSSKKYYFYWNIVDLC